MKKEFFGYCDVNQKEPIIFLPAVQWEVTPKQMPIDILRLRRIYNKRPSNYWFKSRNKIKEYKLIKITVEDVNETSPKRILS